MPTLPQAVSRSNMMNSSDIALGSVAAKDATTATDPCLDTSVSVRLQRVLYSTCRDPRVA